MKQWMHARPLRTLGVLAALSLVLTACDPQDVMRLLDAQPVAREAPAAAKADREADGADAPEEQAPEDHGAAADEAPADDRATAQTHKKARTHKRSEAKGEERVQRRTRQRRERQVTTTEDAPAAKQRSGGGAAGSGGGGGSADLSGVEQAIHDRLTSTRRSTGLTALSLSAEISKGAKSWSCQMAQSGNFRHADLGSAGVSGENIAWGQRGAAAVHDAWMTSPGHRDNRMSSRWSEYGVGVCNDSNGRPYYTERFR